MNGLGDGEEKRIGNEDSATARGHALVLLFVGPEASSAVHHLRTECSTTLPREFTSNLHFKRGVMSFRERPSPVCGVSSEPLLGEARSGCWKHETLQDASV
jgi:hypothetical protein